MPNSLKSRLKGLVRKGLLSEKDLSRIYTDNDVVEELETIKKEILKHYCTICWVDLRVCKQKYHCETCKGFEKLIDNHIEELKGENENDK